MDRKDGLYYVTICVEGKKTVFGTVKESGVHLSKMGELVDALTTLTSTVSGNAFSTILSGGHTKTGCR